MTFLILLLLASFGCPPQHPTALASWYGRDFHGRLTSCGETFDMNDSRTFAHKELPPGVVVRFYNTEAGIVWTAIANDDGPYWGDREFDLSYAAFCELTGGHSELGVVELGWEIIGYKPRSTMRWNRYGTGEYADTFRREVDAFVKGSRLV